MAGKEERGTDIAIHHLVIFFSAGIDEWFVIPNSGVVNQDMQCSEVLFCCQHGTQSRLFLTHIADYRYGSTTCGLDHLHQLVETGLPARSQYKTSYFFG